MVPSPVSEVKDAQVDGETVVIDDSLVQAEQELLESEQESEDSAGEDQVVNDGDVEMQDLTADAGKGLDDIAQMYQTE